jgi:bifunctional non-homologous end joining protein LigD
LNPADKRLAMMTEDHPLEYAGFEGVILEGEYGAGTVMVWDAGTYEPSKVEPPIEKQVARGELKATLRGKSRRAGSCLSIPGSAR